MENQLQVFNSDEFGQVRVIGDFDNPRFCLSDVCRALEIVNPSDVKKRLDDDLVTIEGISDGMGRTQNMTFITEAGLYDVLIDSRKPNAKKFRKWLTGEVAVSIRKTGSYSVNNVAQRGNVAHTQMQILCTAADDIKALADKMQQTFAVKQGMALAKATTVTEKIYQMDLTVFKELLAPVEDAGTLTATEIAKLVGMKSGQAVNKALCAQELAERTASGLQLTEKGKQYGEQIPYAAPNGHCGYQIKWNRNVIPLLQ